MLKAVSAAHGAAPVAGIKAESTGFIFTGFGCIRLSKKIADRVKRPYVACGIGACSLADRRLINVVNVFYEIGTL